MFPWSHLALGYLLYVLFGRLRMGWTRTEVGAVALAFGTQMPDLDKVLAWWFGVIPNGRTLLHSMLVAFVLLSLVRWYAGPIDRRHEGDAFALGYVSHLFGDVLYPLAVGNIPELRFLAWPVLRPVDYDHTGGFVAFFTSVDPGLIFWLELGLTALAMGVWYSEGLPGLRVCWSRMCALVDAIRPTVG